MELLCLGKVTDRGRIGTNNRLFLEALLWITLRGSRWRDLPYNFGKLNTVLKGRYCWVKARIFENF